MTLSGAIDLVRQARRRLRYLGLRYRCPFCGSHLRKMLPFGLKLEVFDKAHVVGGGYRENVLCPVCYSSDRERLLLLFIKERTTLLQKPQRILHFAPERHIRQLLTATPGVFYCSADLAMPGVQVRLDIARLPFRDGCFDFIICCHVLEHVMDDEKAMRQLHAALRPGGQAIIQVPIGFALKSTFEDPTVAPADREKTFGQDDHVRLYALDVVQRLEAAGFRVRTEFPGRDRGDGRVERVAVNPEEPVFVCERPPAD